MRLNLKWIKAITPKRWRQRVERYERHFNTETELVSLTNELSAYHDKQVDLVNKHQISGQHLNDIKKQKSQLTKYKIVLAAIIILVLILLILYFVFKIIYKMGFAVRFYCRNNCFAAATIAPHHRQK